MMKPYVIHRLLNQRARMKAPPPEPCSTPPPQVRREWEPDSDEYDTELEDEVETREKEKLEGESLQVTSGRVTSGHMVTC